MKTAKYLFDHFESYSFEVIEKNVPPRSAPGEPQLKNFKWGILYSEVYRLKRYKKRILAKKKSIR